MKINKEKCIGCHACVGLCPQKAIIMGADGKMEIDSSKCINCKACAMQCYAEAIEE